jgi:hypothetical protein
MAALCGGVTELPPHATACTVAEVKEVSLAGINANAWELGELGVGVNVRLLLFLF